MARTSKYTREMLEEAVAKNQTMAGVLRSFGLNTTGGNHRMLQQRLRAWNIDTSHFVGKSWSSGKTVATDERIRHLSETVRTPDSEVFRCGSTYPSSHLRKRLIRLGWKEECSICGISEWMGKPLRCHVDHINGDTSDNRKENLRFVCPNCHQQTETWGNGKRDNGHKA